MSKRKIESWKKQQESQIQNMILGELKKLKNQKVTFSLLLEECRKRKSKLSKVTLTRHLKNLMRTNEVEKVFDSDYIRGYYRIKEKGLAKLLAESMIQYLGLTATHYIVNKKLNKPTEIDIFEEIERYLKEKPEAVSWEDLSKYLEENRKLII